MDDYSQTTTMKYKIQATNNCSNTIPNDAINYTENQNISLDNESYNGKYICFWSEDEIGNIGKAISEQITGVDTSFPTVVRITSNNTNNSYKQGSKINISIIFSAEAIINGNSPYLELNTNQNATYVSGNNTNTLNFEYIVKQGDNVDRLNY